MRRFTVPLLVCVVALCFIDRALHADPAYYIERDTWQATMRASRNAVVRTEAEQARRAVEKRRSDPILRAFRKFKVEFDFDARPVHIEADITGLDSMCFRVTQAELDDRGEGVICLGSPALTKSDGEKVELVPGRPFLRERYGKSHIADHRHGHWKEAKLGKHFDRGFTMRKGGELVFRLDGEYERFDAWICAHPIKSREDMELRFEVDYRSLQKLEEQHEHRCDKLWPLVARDFPAPVFCREQARERRDHIWQEEWTPGDVKELAMRYARRTDGEVRTGAIERAKAAKSPRDIEAVRAAYYFKSVKERVAFARKTLEFVRQAVRLPKLVARLEALEKAVARPQDHQGMDWHSAHAAAFKLRRSIIFSHPLLDFDRLLINQRARSRYDHMCDQYLGRHSGVGPGLCILESWKDNPRKTVLLEDTLPPGSVLHPDLSFDAERVVFAYCDHSIERNNERRYWIYEVNIDGTGLRQLTGTAFDSKERWGERRTVLVEDWDPCYLPDGGFAFVSTRSQVFGRCHGSRYVPAYLTYRADASGRNIRQLSFGEANEWDPSVLHNGRIIYTRWDYINRHDTNFQSLWSMRPDGTKVAHYYGNYSVGPCMIAEARAIPNSHKVVATATDHHGATSGSMIVIDPHKGRDGGAPLMAVTPELGFPERGAPRGTEMAPRPARDDIPSSRRRRSATPWPLSEDLFLAAYAHGDRYAIYLVDTLGGRELIYRDKDASSFSPIPVRPRPKPPVMPSTVAGREDEKSGIFYVQDVNRSTQHLERGTIKRLRINRIYGQPTPSKPDLSRANNEIIKGIEGTVPVEPDGSVAFRAPAGTPLQIQALDENGMAVMTMRSFVYLQPGEMTSCVGCHEHRSSTPVRTTSLADSRIRELDPPAGPQYYGGFSFARTVQPVLDKYCIRCHGLDKTEDGISLVGRPSRYNEAHDALVGKGGLVAIAYRNRETVFSKPRDYFAHAGRLASLLMGEHRKYVKLDRESFQCIVDWLDLNAQYYGDYSHNRPENRRPDGKGERVLREYIQQLFGEEIAGQDFAALVNVAIPEQSRILRAPLAVRAGGWGQLDPAWPDKNDNGYKLMLELVRGAIAPMREHDIAGTCGRDRCCCRSCWVRKLKAEYDKTAHAD